jgi:hypothetical protein
LVDRLLLINSNTALPGSQGVPGTMPCAPPTNTLILLP